MRVHALSVALSHTIPLDYHHNVWLFVKLRHSLSFLPFPCGLCLCGKTAPLLPRVEQDVLILPLCSPQKANGTGKEMPESHVRGTRPGHMTGLGLTIAADPIVQQQRHTSIIAESPLFDQSDLWHGMDVAHSTGRPSGCCPAIRPF